MNMEDLTVSSRYSLVCFFLSFTTFCTVRIGIFFVKQMGLVVSARKVLISSLNLNENLKTVCPAVQRKRECRNQREGDKKIKQGSREKKRGREIKNERERSKITPYFG